MTIEFDYRISIYVYHDFGVLFYGIFLYLYIYIYIYIYIYEYVCVCVFIYINNSINKCQYEDSYTNHFVSLIL